MNYLLNDLEPAFEHGVIKIKLTNVVNTWWGFLTYNPFCHLILVPPAKLPKRVLALL